MNEEHLKIYNAVHSLKEKMVEIEVKQEERHKQNRTDMNALGDLTRSVERHCNEIGKLKVHRSVHWVILTAIAAAVILA